MKSLSIVTALLLTSKVANAAPDHELKTILCEAYSDSFARVIQQEAKEQEGFVAMMISMLSMAYKSASSADSQTVNDNKMVISANVAGMVSALNFSSSEPNFEPFSESLANQVKRNITSDCISDYENYGQEIRLTDDRLRRI